MWEEFARDIPGQKKKTLDSDNSDELEPLKMALDGVTQEYAAKRVAKKMKIDGKGKGASKNSAIAVRPSYILPRNRIHHNHK